MKTDNWWEPLLAQPDPTAAWHRYVFERRAAFQVLLPPGARGRVLCLMPGAVPVALARSCREVVTVASGTDGDVLRSRSLPGLEVVDRLPERGEFDAVVADAPVDFARLRGLVQPDGYIYVAGHNRLRGKQEGAATLSGYRNGLKRAGFPVVRGYTGFSDLARLNLARRWLSRFYAFVAGRRRERSWAELLLERVVGGAVESAPDLVNSGSTAGGVVMMAPEAVVRIPLGVEAERRIRRNQEGLIAAARYGIRAPRAIEVDELHGLVFSAETRVSGKPLDGGSDDEVFELMLSLPRGGENPGLWDREVAAAWDRAGASWGHTRELRDAASTVAAASADLPIGFSHGDFHPGNVLMADDGPILVDWDNWREHHFATIDFVHFLCRRRLTAGDPVSVALCDWVEDGPRDEQEAAWSAAFEKAHGLEAGWRAPAAAAYWARELAARVGTPADLNQAWIRLNFEAVAPRLAAALA